LSQQAPLAMIIALKIFPLFHSWRPSTLSLPALLASLPLQLLTSVWPSNLPWASDSSGQPKRGAGRGHTSACRQGNPKECSKSLLGKSSPSTNEKSKHAVLDNYPIRHQSIGVGLSYSKPSRSEEAWSFASAKVPKLNASEGRRWSD
jgi:hypothetical protein